MDLESFRAAVREVLLASSTAQVKEIFGKRGYKHVSEVPASEYEAILFDLEVLSMDKKVDGFETLSGKEDKGFWIVHTLGENFSILLKYHTLKAAKEQAQERLKSSPGRTVYVFKASCIITARIEAEEVRLS